MEGLARFIVYVLYPVARYTSYELAVAIPARFVVFPLVLAGCETVMSVSWSLTSAGISFCFTVVQSLGRASLQLLGTSRERLLDSSPSSPNCNEDSLAEHFPSCTLPQERVDPKTC